MRAEGEIRWPAEIGRTESGESKVWGWSEKRRGAARREKRRGKLGEFQGFRLNKKNREQEAKKQLEIWG